MPRADVEPDPYFEIDQDPDLRVVEFGYLDHLWLVRLKEAPVKAGEHKPWFIVAKDYTVEWKSRSSDGVESDTSHKVTVPAGYKTDFASVPGPLRAVVSRIGPWAEASVVHDYLCDAWKWHDQTWVYPRRKWADKLMLSAMEEAKIGWQKWAIFAAVYAYGCGLSVLYALRLAPPYKTERSHYIVDLNALGVVLPPEVNPETADP